MNDTPDFRTKTPAIDPMAFANVLQRKAQLEQEQRNYEDKTKYDRINNLMEAVKTGQQIASNMMNLAEKRRETQGLKDLTSLITQPAPEVPNPTASSTALPEQGQFHVQPSSEQMSGYEQKIQTRQKAMVNALARANKEKFTEYASKSLFATPKENNLSLEQKDILFNDKPTVALFDKNSGNYYDASNKQQLIGHITPYSPNTDTELTDKDRAELTPMAKAIVEGRASANALVSARGARKEKLSRIVAELDPGFDLSLAPQRVAIRKDFSSAGKTGQALTSLNTVIGHLDTLDSKIAKLDNSQFPKYNSLVNYAKKNVGKPEVSEFIAAKGLVISELGKIAQGSGVVTNEERKEFSTAIDTASSPAQAKAVIDTWMTLIKSRTDSIKANWDQTMPGVTPPTPFINAKSKEKLIKHGYNPKTLEKSNGAEDEANNFLKGLGL